MVDNRGDVPQGSFLISVTGVAVGAAEVAAGQPDEDAGNAAEGGFTLDAVKDLIDL